LLALSNIICHLNTLLTDEQKAAINWHSEQSVSLAVMRVLSDLNKVRAATAPQDDPKCTHCGAVLNSMMHMCFPKLTRADQG
jgi:hypothetical protein